MNIRADDKTPKEPKSTFYVSYAYSSHTNGFGFSSANMVGDGFQKYEDTSDFRDVLLKENENYKAVTILNWRRYDESPRDEE